MLLRESCGKLSGAFPENKQVRQRITAETICSMKATAALAGSEQAGHRRHLRLWMNADAAHDVVHRWPNFHRSCRNVDIGELLELVVHTRQLLLNVFRRVWDFFFDPGDVEKYTAMRTSPAFLDLAHDAAGDVVSCQQFGRAARLFITLTISPAFFFVVGRLMAISFRDVIKHESATFAVSQNAALTAYAFGHQDSRNARRPDHSCWMELHELHVHKVGTGVVCQRVPIACIFPTVTCDLVGTADSAGCQNNGLCLKQQKPAALAVITKSSDNTISIFQEGENRALHVHIDPLVYAVVLKGADHFEARAIANVSETRVPKSSEVSLKNISLARSIENSTPRLQLAHTCGRLFRVEFGHTPVVHVLAPAHRVGKMNFPVVGGIDRTQRCRDAALGHDGMRLPEKRFADQPDGDSASRSFDRRAESSATGANNKHVVFEFLIFGHLNDSPVRPDTHRAKPHVYVGKGNPEQAAPGPA